MDREDLSKMLLRDSSADRAKNRMKYGWMMKDFRPINPSPKFNFKERYIPFHDKMTEAQYIAELYHQLRLRDVPVRVEYVCKIGKYVSRFDLVVVKGNTIILIVEVKDTFLEYSKREKLWKETRQYDKYRMYNTPILFVTSTLPIDVCADSIAHIFTTSR